MPNPFARSRWYMRSGNMLLTPIFRILPTPGGCIVLTVTGRRSGRAHQRVVRAIRQDTTLYVNTWEGRDWLRNVRKNPRVVVKAGRHSQAGLAREVSDAAERESAKGQYVREVSPFEYMAYAALLWSWPTRRRLIEWHRDWAENGVMLAIDLDPPAH